MTSERNMTKDEMIEADKHVGEDSPDPYESLCYYDKRNPNFIGNEYSEPRKSTCYCDNCFRGKDELAMEILRLRKITGEK